MDNHPDTLRLIGTIENGVDCILDKCIGEDNTVMIRNRIALAVATFLVRFSSKASVSFDCDQSNNPHNSPYITVTLFILPNHCHNTVEVKCRTQSSQYSTHYAFKQAMKGI